MKHALWIGEEFTDANPACGITNSAHNFWNTFKNHVPEYTFNTVFIEGGGVDDRITEYCNNNPVDIVLVTLLGASPLNPATETLERLKNEGKKVCILWPDTGPNWGISTICAIGEKVNLHVSIDYPVGQHINDYTPLPNHIFLWTPEDDSLYYPDDKSTIDVSFLGSKVYYDRSRFLAPLSQKDTKYTIILGGGQREEKLSATAYAEVVRRSKIGINFSLSPTMQFHQLKGRVLEYIASKSMLLEMANPATRQFFLPGEDYVEFFDYNDLCNKIDFYMANNEERERIAENGYNKFIANYSARHFWNGLLEELEIR